MGVDVTIVDLVDRPLPVLPREVSEAVRRIHERHGVRFRLGRGVAALHGDTSVSGVELADGEVLTADLVLVGVGLQPNDSLASKAGAEVHDGVVVDAMGRSSVPGLYAVGDVARQRQGFLGQSLRHEHWKGAHSDGDRLGRFLATGVESQQEIPWCWTDQFETNIQISGTPRPDDAVVYRGDPASESFIAFHRRAGTWTGVIAVDRPRDARLAARLVGTQSSVAPEALRDESRDLKQIFRAESMLASST